MSIDLENKFHQYNLALKELISSLVSQILENQNFINNVIYDIEAIHKGKEANAYDSLDGLIHGSVTEFHINDEDLCFKTKTDDECFTLEWTIPFNASGMADVGCVNSESEYKVSTLNCSCEGQVEINIPDNYLDFFELFPENSVEEIIEEIVKNIVSNNKFKVNIDDYNVFYDENEDDYSSLNN